VAQRARSKEVIDSHFQQTLLVSNSRLLGMGNLRKIAKRIARLNFWGCRNIETLPVCYSTEQGVSDGMLLEFLRTAPRRGGKLHPSKTIVHHSDLFVKIRGRGAELEILQNYKEKIPSPFRMRINPKIGASIQMRVQKIFFSFYQCMTRRNFKTNWLKINAMPRTIRSLVTKGNKFGSHSKVKRSYYLSEVLEAG